MHKFDWIPKIFVMLSFLNILRFSDLQADVPENTVLKMEYLISLTTFGNDTVFRYFSYYPNGSLRSIKDSTGSDWRVIYSAEYDSSGKIIKLSEYRPDFLYSVDYVWEKDNRIKYTKQKNGVNGKDSGTIKYYGALRAVDLPENNPLAPENFILVRADSTQYLDSDGNIITTWYWDYDSSDRCIRWGSSTLEETIPWVEEYTYGAFNDLPARYPALSGDIVVFIHDNVAVRHKYGSRLSKQYHKDKVYSGNHFLLNGRKVGTEGAGVLKKISTSMIATVNDKNDEKLQVILPGNKK